MGRFHRGTPPTRAEHSPRRWFRVDSRHELSEPCFPRALAAALRRMRRVRRRLAQLRRRLMELPRQWRPACLLLLRAAERKFLRESRGVRPRAPQPRWIFDPGDASLSHLRRARRGRLFGQASLPTRPLLRDDHAASDGH